MQLDLTSCEDHFEVSVQDTGIGISADGQKRLFRAFEQLDGGIDRKYEGTGLGLVMVKSLVELHGGTLGVESEIGKRSRFWARMPRTQASAAQVCKADVPEMMRTSSRDGAHILVIDDDAAALKLAHQWLSTQGYSVELAPDCDRAWARMQERRPDAILLDILFSEGPGGWEYLAKLKEDPHFASVPVVIVSIVPDQKRGIALGAADVLQKPVAGPDLLRAVESLRLSSGSEQARILVVDDDPRAVEHVSQRLEAAGMHVTRCYGGADALALLAGGGFSAMVLDIMMPEVSGFDVIRELHAQPATADLPVIVVTAKALEMPEKELLKKAVDSVLMKGEWDEREFVQTVRAVLQTRGRQPAPLRAQPLASEPTLLKHKRHILVIDDNNEARSLLGLYLEDAGYRVTIAADGGDAIAKLEGLRPDLITFDLDTPSVDWLAFLTDSPESKPLRGVPVVLIANATAPELALGLGAHAILPKPVRRHEFLEVVGRILGQREERRPYVLVVDDDPKAIKVISSYFSK